MLTTIVFFFALFLSGVLFIKLINNWVIEANHGTFEGRDYIVYNTSKAPCCNTDIIDVGVAFTIKTGTCTCKCGKVYLHGGVNWKNASRFVKIEEASKKEETKEVSAITLTKQLVLSEN